MNRLVIIFSLVLIAFQSLYAQENVEQNLAYQYYNSGEYEKAAGIFEKLYSKDPTSTSYYRYLYNSLIFTKEYDKLEKIIARNIKKNPENLSYRVDLGNLLIQQGNVSRGKKEYKDAIKELQPSDKQVIHLANAFVNYNELELAAETYEEGRKLLGDSYLFVLELADLYQKLDDPGKTIHYYLTYVDYNINDIQSIQNRLQEIVQQKDFSNELQSQLLSRIQKYPQIVAYSELLIWHYIQQKNFKAAIIQSKALDRRLNENGYRLVNIARAAVKENEYDIAADAYKYVIDKGPGNAFYLKAQQELLSSYKEKITGSLDYTGEDLIKLNNEFDKFIKEFGVNANTAGTIREKAQLLAFYLDDYDKAIALLEDLLSYPQIGKQLKGEFKLELGDFYIMKEEIWEASLLYSQVDKDFDDEPLGEMARFKNAKLSYYRGEFEWAQAQLNILKASTSELIANDALKLSVFIMDNLGLDSTLYPMEKFARADLLFYQNKFDEAKATLDSITRIFPNHSLADDIYFMKAKISLRKHEYDKVVQYLESIIEDYSEDLLGDDAHFMLAELNEHKLGNKERAQQLYQDLIFKYKDSIYIIEARKRFRELRGDQL